MYFNIFSIDGPGSGSKLRAYTSHFYHTYQPAHLILVLNAKFNAYITFKNTCTLME